jgi:hypothetical protein
MEKFVTEIGFGIVCISFFLCLCVGTQCVTGAVIGMVIMAFGCFFWED